MTTLAHGISLRDGDVPVLETTIGTVRRNSLLTARPPAGVSDADAAALSIASMSALVQTLVALDGRSSALLLLPPDLPPVLVEDLALTSGCTQIISDRHDLPGAVPPQIESASAGSGKWGNRNTEWLLTTSGTTGRPKILRHTLRSLSRTTRPSTGAPRTVWGLTYQATRFAGLQVLLQAILGGATLVAPDGPMDLPDRIRLFTERGCTHLSATPTTWRRILMHPASAALRLRQITLGGEIADQTVLDALHARFPTARITHVYASTEVGVGFSVQDGLEGFPASYLAGCARGVRLRLREGRLWLRAPGPPNDYIGGGHIDIDDDGFVDTQDRVERRADRIYFLGRETGAVNVGGVKVYPEVVERILTQLPEVAFARVAPRRNPLSGALLVATVVPAAVVDQPDMFKAHVLRHCRANLEPAAVPALISLAESVDTTPGGKIARYQ